MRTLEEVNVSSVRVISMQVTVVFENH